MENIKNSSSSDEKTISLIKMANDSPLYYGGGSKLIRTVNTIVRQFNDGYYAQFESNNGLSLTEVLIKYLWINHWQYRSRWDFQWDIPNDLKTSEEVELEKYLKDICEMTLKKCPEWL